MGLFQTLVTMVAGWAGLLPHQNRRTYSVAVFGQPAGSFKLPRADFLPDPNTPRRNLLTRPFKVDFADYYYFYWIEEKPEGGYKTTTWHAETADERAEAKRFYDACHSLDSGVAYDGARGGLSLVRSDEERKLIEAIRADRNNDEAYINYANFLIDRNDRYGEYIRLTLQREKLPEGDEKREKLDERRQKLVDKHGAKWVRPLTDVGLFPGFHLGDIDGFMPDSWFNSKGVIEELDVPCGSNVFPGNSAKFFFGAPLLRSFSVNTMDVTLAEFGRIPGMSQIESLRAAVGTSSPEDMMVFAESPHLGGLRTLDISGNHFGPEGAAPLANARWLSGLRSLNIQSCHIQDQGVEALASSPGVANLETLNLSSNSFGDAGLIALATSPHLGNLKEVSIGGNSFGDAGIRALTQAPFLPRLKSLALDSCNAEPETMRALLATPFTELRSITLASTPIGDAVLVNVITAPYFHTLTSLTVIDCEAGDLVAGAIGASGFNSLTVLNLSRNRITNSGVVALCQSKALSKLTLLNLCDNPFGDAGVKAIASANLPAVEELTLYGVEMGAEGVAALCKGEFPKLTRLWVTEEHVGPAGKEQLTKRFGDAVLYM